MMRLMELAFLLFWFLFVARVIWSVWLRGFLIKEGIIANGDKATKSNEHSTTGDGSNDDA